MATVFTWRDTNKFFSVVKNKVYERNHETASEFKNYILDTLVEIEVDRNLCRSVCQSYMESFEEYCNVEGGHFEHLVDFGQPCIMFYFLTFSIMLMSNQILISVLY